MRSRKFGMLLAVLLVLGSLVAGPALAEEDDSTLTEEEAFEEASVLCHNDVECIKRCAEALLAGYGCRL